MRNEHGIRHMANMSVRIQGYLPDKMRDNYLINYHLLVVCSTSWKLFFVVIKWTHVTFIRLKLDMMNTNLSCWFGQQTGFNSLSHWGSFMVDTGFYQTIWSFPLTNGKWLSMTWPYTMITPYWSDYVPNSTFYRILRCFHRTFTTGVACRHGTLTPPDTWNGPFRTCICSTC